MDQTLSQEKNGVMVVKNQASLIQPNWIAASGAVLNKDSFDLMFYYFNSIHFDNATQTLELGDYTVNPINVNFKKTVAINCVVLRENLSFGQRVRKFVVQIMDEETGRSIFIPGTSIGRLRIITFPTVKTRLVMIRFPEASANPMLKPFELFHIDEQILPPGSLAQ